MKRVLVWVGALLALVLLMLPRDVYTQTVKYLTDLSAAVAIADTDTYFWCQVSTGCISTTPLVRGTATQLPTYIFGKVGGDFTIGSTGTGTLATSGVSAGPYTSANITVDAKGRVTAASNGGGGGAGFGVDGGTSAQSVTGTATLANATRLVKIASGWTTGTLTLPAISAVSTDTGICIDDGGAFVTGSATLTVKANAVDGINGGAVGGTVGPYTGSGIGLCFRVSATHNWTAESGATIPTSTAPANQFANSVGINGLGYAQPAIGGISGLGTGVATAAGNALSAAGGLTSTIAAGTAALGTGAISSATCAAAVTVAATNTATTDVVTASFNGDPTAVTGYIPATTGMLTIVTYPTANNVNFKVCNNTSASITPGAITLNWRVAR